jgi:hypothetical protein
VNEEGRRVIVVQELLEPGQNLIREIPRPELPDYLLFDAVEDAGQALLFAAAEIESEDGSEPVQRPALPSIELSPVSFDTDQRFDPAVHAHRREKERAGNRGPLLSEEALEEILFSKARRAHFVVLGHRSVFPESAPQPRSIRVEMSQDGAEKIVEDFRLGLEPREVVAECAREGAARKSREFEHGKRPIRMRTLMLAQDGAKLAA